MRVEEWMNKWRERRVGGEVNVVRGGARVRVEGEE